MSDNCIAPVLDPKVDVKKSSRLTSENVVAHGLIDPRYEQEGEWSG